MAFVSVAFVLVIIFCSIDDGIIRQMVILEWFSEVHLEMLDLLQVFALRCLDLQAAQYDQKTDLIQRCYQVEWHYDQQIY